MSTAAASNTSITLFLVLPADAVTPGASYGFSLLARYVADSLGAVSGKSSLALARGQRRAFGRCARDRPHFGEALTTVFTLRCSSWVDDTSDLPLSYSLYYAIADSANGAEYQIFSASSYMYRSDVYLPRGGGNASDITVIAYIADTHGATARATAAATISPLWALVEELANLSAVFMDALFKVGNVEGVLGMVVVTGTELSAVKCSSLAGSVGGAACASLARATCDADFVCDACVDGHVGYFAPSNTPCWVAPADMCADGDVTPVGGASAGHRALLLWKTGAVATVTPTTWRSTPPGPRARQRVARCTRRWFCQRCHRTCRLTTTATRTAAGHACRALETLCAGPTSIARI